MTNEQRDELLVSLSKGINNLQELIIDTNKELKAELNNFKVETNAKFDKLETKVDGLETKVDGLETKVVGLETDLNSFRKQTQKNFDEIPPQVADIAHTTWGFMARDKQQIIERLDKHDEEINKLKSCLA